MRRATADDRAEGDDGVVFTLLRDLLGDQRNLEGTRCADDGDVVFADAVANQRVDRAADQALDDEAVEAAYDQGVFLRAMKVPSMVFRGMGAFSSL